VLLFVVARTRLDRYEALRREFEDWRDVRILLDRREPHETSAVVERRRVERRQQQPDLRKLGWAVVETDGPML
jgi:hypothetical protein